MQLQRSLSKVALNKNSGVLEQPLLQERPKAASDL